MVTNILFYFVLCLKVPDSVVELQRLNETHGTSTARVQLLFPREHDGSDSSHCLVTENVTEILMECAKFPFQEEASAPPEPLLGSGHPGIASSIPGKQQWEKAGSAPGITDKISRIHNFNTQTQLVPSLPLEKRAGTRGWGWGH